ncbi:MAG TPA: trigger factor [Candidatus Dormibacteraeota bacterium]|nr:trigger factor [Candidatus Dormibacteraeota bacterium]
MQIKREQISPTKAKLTIVADQPTLDEVKQAVLSSLSQNVKVPGFRPGKAPANLVEKQVDQSLLQSEFLDQAVNRLYVEAIQQEQLRPVAPPQVSVTKFVPFTALEVAAEVDVIGDIKLADYKKIKLAPKTSNVTAEDVSQVLDNLRGRAAVKKPVERAAKLGDEATINFKGTDAKTSEPIEGGAGEDYPLVLGSKTFIPGFEDELVGIKPGGEKTFTLTFPEDYGVKSLQGRKVSFAVTVTKLQELEKSKLDDTFAATVGPFKTLAELKADVKKQLTLEKQRADRTAFENELLEKIAAKSTVAIPERLIEEEIDRLEDEEKRDVVYRGQTWQEHLKAEGLTAEAHREQKRETATGRIKAGLILSEIAERENISVTPEELEIRMQLLKGQYPDAAMQAELDKPESRRDIASRMMAEKTLDLLRASSSK